MTGAERRFSSCANGQARKFLESSLLFVHLDVSQGVLLHFGISFAADRSSPVGGV